jgi:hypothetical protein
MNLSELRNEFAEKSGFLDSVNPDGSDNGADFYINAGQKYLDRLFEKREDIGRVFRVIQAGDYFVKFSSHCRAIHEVGVGNRDSFHWIERYQLTELRKKFNQPFEFLESATPSAFAPAYLRPAGTDGDFDGIVGYMDVMAGWREYNGIILMPPADAEYHVEVWGKFYSERLDSDDSESFWTVNFPEILIMAAQRELEAFYRNSQGVNDWDRVIQGHTLEIGKDFIEEEFYATDQMRG